MVHFSIVRVTFSELRTLYGHVSASFMNTQVVFVVGCLWLRVCGCVFVVVVVVVCLFVVEVRHGTLGSGARS